MGSGFNLYCWSGIHFSWSNSLIFCCCIFRRCFCKFRNFITIFDFLFIILFHTSWTFISLQIKEFRIMGLSINDSVYSSLFFFLTGLHFFHLLFGLLLLCLFFW